MPRCASRKARRTSWWIDVLTADTITDEQILELRHWGGSIISDAGMALLLGKPGEIKALTLLEKVMVCRARCAEILNTRDTFVAQGASTRAANTISEVIFAVLNERKLYIVKPQHPTMGEVALEAYGFGKACDAVALQGDDLQALLLEIGVRCAEILNGR
jgi:hypothetical protein